MNPLIDTGSAEARIRELRFAKDYDKHPQNRANGFSDLSLVERVERVVPVSGKEMKQFLQEIPEDPKVQRVIRQLLGPGPLPAAR